MSQRERIALTAEEVSNFLGDSRTMILVSNGKGGYPHPIPMWYATDDENNVYMTTFRKSQKVANLMKDPKVALLVESGDAYEELKGVILYADVEFIDDVEAIQDIIYRISVQRGGLEDSASEEVRLASAQAAPKRIGMKFTPREIVSWDHSKLGGNY